MYQPPRLRVALGLGDQELEQRLRRSPTGISVVARVEDDHLVLDLRTVFPEQEPQLVKTLGAALH